MEAPRHGTGGLPLSCSVLGVYLLCAFLVSDRAELREQLVRCVAAQDADLGAAGADRFPVMRTAADRPPELLR